MKAVTIKAPYAQLIMLGLKHYETRKTRRLHKVVGQRIAIHCGKDAREFLDIRAGLSAVPCRDNSWLIEEALQARDISMFDDGWWKQQAGCIIATAVVGYPLQVTQGLVNEQTPLELASGYWLPRYYVYPLTDIEPLPTPVPARGNVTLWDWTPEGVSV